MGEVQEAVEHHDGEGHLERHAEQFDHQGDGRQVHGAHQEALDVVRPLEAVVHERQADLEGPCLPVRGDFPDAFLVQRVMRSSRHVRGLQYSMI